MIKDSGLKTFNQIYTDFHPRFVRFADSYVHDIAVAEDFTMEAFITYWENKDKLLPNSNIASYILTIIKNKCINYLEHIKIRNQVLNNISELSSWELNTRIMSLEACNPEKLFSDEILQLVEQTLAELNERTTMVFRMSRDKNLTNREIADMLDISVKGVEFHISKALTALRKNLKDYFPLYILFFYLR